LQPYLFNVNAVSVVWRSRLVFKQQLRRGFRASGVSPLWLFPVLLLVVMSLNSTAAQKVESRALNSPLGLEDAVHYALAHHPALGVANAAEQEAAANLDIARDQYIPRGDIGLQENRATGNVVPGTHFAMTGIPPVSGPPTDRVFDSGVWGSTAGLSLSYDIAHLTQYMILADAALAERLGARANTEAQALAVAFGAADAFALTVEAEEQVKAGRVNVNRAEVLHRTIDALAQSGLRPGADAARAAAEVALAQTQLIHAEEAAEVSQAQLAQALGAAGESIKVWPGRLVEQPPPITENERISPLNPLILSADRAVRAADDRKRAAVLEYIPRVEIAAALWGRGNGLFPGGAKLGFAQGVAPDTLNWASGVVVTIPILQYPEIRARNDLAAAKARSALADRDLVIQQVQTQIDSARAILRNTYRAADEARISLQSSRAALSQAEARYKAGLYSIDAVAEALRLVAQAEAGDAVARTDIWRARMLLARAVGDLGPLLADISEASGGH
jgi:outer membrane protein